MGRRWICPTASCGAGVWGSAGRARPACTLPACMGAAACPCLPAPLPTAASARPASAVSPGGAAGSAHLGSLHRCTVGVCCTSVRVHWCASVCTVRARVLHVEHVHAPCTVRACVQCMRVHRVCTCAAYAPCMCTVHCACMCAVHAHAPCVGKCTMRADVLHMEHAWALWMHVCMRAVHACALCVHECAL